MDKFNTPYHVWRRNDGHVSWSKGAEPPRAWVGTDGSAWEFETLLTTHDVSEAHNRLVTEQS